MKVLKRIMCIIVASIICGNCMASVGNKPLSPSELIEKLYKAGVALDYELAKECVSQRNIYLIDVAKDKMESDEMQMKKSILLFILQMIQYEILEEQHQEDGSALVKVRLMLADENLHCDVVLIDENGKWKVDDVPNAQDMLDESSTLGNFIK